jgi:XTP/dITP diphosphohydrolase
MDVRFLSRNPHKASEAKEILSVVGINVIAITVEIEELQTTDVRRLVRDKTIKAFNEVGRPLFVEHTGLELSYLNGLPGGLTQIFWDSLEADKFAHLFGKTEDTSVTARTLIGYCDGRTLHFFEGKIEGKIAEEPRGDRAFQWDCVFIPKGYSETFAEMGKKKNEISMRRKALDEFSAFMREES